jgi:hypothetical protein
MSSAGRDDAIPDDLPEDTIPVRRGEVVPDDQTVRVERGGPASASDSGRAGERGAVEPGADEPAADELDDDATVLSGRTGGDTQPSEGGDGMPDGTPGPRRHAADADAEQRDEPDDGSTMVARRESRRRAAREESPVAPAPLAQNSAAGVPGPSARIAQTPGDTPPIYQPRAPEPVVADRSAPPPRPPQVPVDVRAAMLHRRRRARQLALVGVIAACFVVTVLLAALVAFTTTVGW